MDNKLKTMRMPTLSDVASEAGVSKIAVSVVLNGSRTQTRVSEATRERILEVAKRLNYQPNAAARSLIRKQTDCIGVLFGAVPVGTSAIREVYGASILQGITDACGRRDFDLMLFTKTGLSDLNSAVARLRNQRTDGVIIIAPHAHSGLVESVVSMGVRAIAVSYPDPEASFQKSPRWLSVDVDNYKGARLAVEHLIALGHRRIAHLMGTPTVVSAQERFVGYRDALQAAGLPYQPELVVVGKNIGTPGCEDGSYSGETSAQDTIQLMQLPVPPTALFVGNDGMAVEAMRGAQSIGLQIPGDLSIIGFDDRQIASVLTPPLTTVRQPMLSVGELAADLLIDRIQRETSEIRLGEAGAGEPIPPVCLLAPELIVRGSTGRAPV